MINKTLKGRISLIYFYLVLMSAVIGAIAAFNLLRLNNSIDGLMTANYKSIKAINKMIEHLEVQDRAILIYIKVDSKTGINNFMDNQDLFMEAYNVESNNLTEPGEALLVRHLNSNYMDFLKSFAHLQEIKNRLGVNPAFDYYNLKIRTEFAMTKSVLQKLAVLNEKAMFRGKRKATDKARHSIYFILVISSFAVCGGFVVSRFFTHRFLKPVDLLKETVKMVKAGDMNRQAPIIYQDEIGELAGEFNNMTKRLLQYEQSTIGTLMAEKNRTLAIVKSIFDPLLVMDMNYRLLLINDAAEKLFEAQEAKAIGKHFLEIVKNGDLFEHISGVIQSGQQEEGLQKIIRFESKGKDYYFNVVVKPVDDLNANTSSMVVLFQNITQIKQLEQVKSDFIATVSHEFKTPLTTVVMGLSLLQEEKIGPLSEQQQQTIKTIQEEGQTLTNLVNDLLEISKMESGQSIFKIQACSIVGIIETAVKKFLELAENKEISLNYEADEDLPKVNADMEKITWVLNNLINNALKYTNAGDRILVSAFVKHDQMCVSVKDTGIGIPAEYQEKLFDKFVQVKGYDLEARGTGLGLAIAKEVIEAHGGEIWYKSELDAGSTFTFTLPLLEDDSHEKSINRG
jgi:PAS domain S-box-containing protein